jgi:hypothetical protein
MNTGRCETLAFTIFTLPHLFRHRWLAKPYRDPLYPRRHVVLPPEVAKLLPRNILLSEVKRLQFHPHSYRLRSRPVALVVSCLAFVGDPPPPPFLLCRSSGGCWVCSRAAGGCTTRSTGRSRTSCCSAARSTTSSSRRKRLPRMCCPSEASAGDQEC